MTTICPTCGQDDEQVQRLRETLHLARMELDRWGRVYSPRNPQVLAVLAKIDGVLDATVG